LEGCERSFAVLAIARQAAELFLLTQGHWLGAGKWLGRRLHDADQALAERLDAALRAAFGANEGPLLTVVAAVVDAAGGPSGEAWSAPVDDLER
jgi:hypothetical protein